jgi:mannosylglucosylglycerate synthase
LPPRSEKISHGVINSLAQQSLKERKGLEATVIPNVFDFDGPDWEKDSYNQDFRAQLGLSENDIVVLQATRLVRRKGIELAVDFVEALNSPERRALLESRGLYDGRSFTKDDRIVLVLAGYAQDDPGGAYVRALENKIKDAGIEAKFIENRVSGHRMIRDGQKVYTLWDTYVFADFITYPSLWEGWGNQLLEAIRAKLPYLVFEYPVYAADIKDKGLIAVSLGGELSATDAAGLVQVAPELIETAADEAVNLLIDGQLRDRVVKHNFEAAADHYSMHALQRQLEQLIESLEAQ